MLKIVAFITLLTVLICTGVFLYLHYGQESSNSTQKVHQNNDSSEEIYEVKQERLSLASFVNYDYSNEKRCGQPLNNYNDRITDGKLASISEFPWIVSIQRERSFWFGFRAFYHSCGGSVITPSWIVTAAHCLYNHDETLRIIAGADNMNFLYKAQLRRVEQTIIHPEFDAVTYNNDLALIKLHKPLNLESSFSRVSAICLERDIPIFTYDIVTVSGFGAAAFRQETQSHLYKTDIAIIDQELCNNSFDQAITDNMICAGGMIYQKRDACSGDSGGPLQIEVNDHQSLIGVVSFGNDCATKGYPGVYTRIDHYYDWIVENIDEELISP